MKVYKKNVRMVLWFYPLLSFKTVVQQKIQHLQEITQQNKKLENVQQCAK